MRRCHAALLLVTTLALAGINPTAIAQQIHTVAGGGPKGNSPALSVELLSVSSVAVDANGNSYVNSPALDEIVRIGPSGVAVIVAGSGTPGYSGDNGPATGAELNGPGGVAVDGMGNVYIADTNNYRIRVVNMQSSAIFVAGVQIEPGDIATVAGTGTDGNTGDNGPATSAGLADPGSIAVDGTGNIYVGVGYLSCFEGPCLGNSSIRKIDTSGVISTVVGTGTSGYSGDGGQATSAQVGAVGGMALDSAGNLYFSQFYEYSIYEGSCGLGCTRYNDYTYYNIRAVNFSSAATRIAGITIQPGDIATIAGSGAANETTYNGDGIPARNANLGADAGLGIDASGNIFVADPGNERIRLINSSGYIYTIAGTGTYGFIGDGNLATSAQVSNPQGVAVDVTGNVYIADTGNGRIRVVSRQSQIAEVSGVQVGPEDIVTVAGGGVGDNNPAPSAELRAPYGVALDGSGNLYIADTDNNRIRVVNTQPSAITVASVQIQPGDIATVAGNGSPGYSGDNAPATSAELYYPQGVAVDSAGNLYIADTYNQRIRKVSATGTITTVAGTGTQGYSGDNGAATSAELNYPYGVSVDSSGNIYIADTNNGRIRVVNPQSSAITIAGVQIQPGNIATIVGNGTNGFGDNGPAPSAALYDPRSVAFDGAGNLYIADSDNSRIRVVNTQSSAITVAGVQIQPGNIATVAGNGGFGYTGDNGPATSADLYYPSGVAVDSIGNIYIADLANARIRKVSTAGVITTIGGSGTYGYNGDQIPATTAWLAEPYGIAVDSSANIYIADLANNRIRRIDSSVAPTATQLVVSAPAQVGAGVPFNVAVTAEDANNNPVTTYSGTVQFNSSDSSAVLPTQTTLTNGTGSFQATLNSAGSQQISATDLVNAWITGSSANIGVIQVVPSAMSQATRALEGSPLTITLAGSDPQGETLTFVLDSAPTSGSLSALMPLNGNSASVTYTPNSQFFGSDSFTFHVVNTSGYSSAEGTVTIGVASTTCNVTDNSDSPSDTGSLRYCVNNAISGQTLTFASSLKGQTITLSPGNGPLTISSNLAIQGPGANLLTISGGNAVQVFSITAGTVSISALTIANGNTSTQGGGIFNNGALTVSNTTFSGNSASPADCCGQGGGIYNSYPGATLTVNNSAFFGNSAYQGGGIFSYGAMLTVNNSTFYANTAKTFGAGISCGTAASVSNSTFSSNSALVYGDSLGGAIFINSLYSPAGSLTLTNSTISGNSAHFGGGLIYGGSGGLTITNSVIAGNTTVSVPGDDCDGCSTPGPGGGGGGGVLNNDLINTPGNIANPQLAPLGWYGGPTQTMIPLLGSPVLGAGQVTASDNPSVDQRGFSRSSATGTTIAIGAVQPNFLIVTTVSDTSDPSPGCDSSGDVPCSLRDALTVANTAPNTSGADIAFAQSLANSTIVLGNSALPAITGNLNLIGQGTGNLTISGNGLSGRGGVFTVNSGAIAAISGITVTGGNSFFVGGGITNYGTLAVSNSTFEGNSGFGGGILNESTLAVSESTFFGNSDTYTGGGAGIANQGALTVTNSTITGNTAAYYGGGIGNQGSLTLSNSIVAENITTGNPGDDCDGCGTPSSYNLINTPANSPAINSVLAPLGNYGGLTQTLLPLPSSPAICAGSSGLVNSSTDQRGFPSINTAYPGTSSSNPCVDLGSVQTNYQSIQFNSAAYNAMYNQSVNPAPVVAVTENGQSIGGIPVTLGFTGTGSATGLGPVTTAAGSGATFGSISVNAVGSDRLSVTLPVVYSYALSASADLTVNPAVPAITWPTPSPISYGTPLGASQLDATASIAGSFGYSPAAGSVLGGGSQTLSATFTPTNSTDYANATATVTLVVNPIAPTVAFTGAPASAGFGTTFNVVATTNSSSSAVITSSGACTIAGNTVTMTSGTGNCILTANWAADSNYLSATATQSVTATKVTPAVVFSGAPASAPYGSTFTVLASTNASTTATITASGSCTASSTKVTITKSSGICSLSASWPADSNFLAATAAQSSTATQATPVIAWATPAAITYGTALTGTQLNAAATNNGATVGGTFTYMPAKGTVLGAGSQTLSVTFTPSNTTNFTSASASVVLQVSQATPKITWAKPAAITYGSALDSTELSATALVAGSLAYSPAPGTILTAGTQTLSVAFTPTDNLDYTTAIDSVTITVKQATSTIAWPTPPAIVYGTPLSGAQLDATASVPGTYNYAPALGVIEPGGSDKLSVSFTPTDSTDYTNATASVTLQVNSATPVLTWPTPAAITFGTALTSAQLNATATYNGASVGGTFTYSPAKGTVLGAGAQTLSVSFTPSNTTNYAIPPSASVTLQVNQATPKITWAKPGAITYGTALSAMQLDAAASVAGTFAYSALAGTVLNGGAQTLSVTFTPTDATDYTTATDSVTITVNTTTSTTTISSNTPNPATVGEAVTVTFSVTGANGVPTGSVAVTASSGESCTGPLGVTGSGSCALTFTATGSIKLTATYSGDINFKGSTSAKVTETVN